MSILQIMSMPPQAPAAQAATCYAPGWYPDPWQMAPFRYHDGNQWTPSLSQPSYGVAVLQESPPDTLTRALLPVGRTGLSIAAGYAGLFTVIPFFAPVALVLGICALGQLRRRPGLYGRGRAIFAIVMGSIFSSVLLLVLTVSLVSHS